MSANSGSAAASALAPARAFIGVHDGHNASVAVVRAGKVEFALQEERLTRIKNQGDAPRLATRRALELVGSSETSVSLNGHYMNYQQWDRETVLLDYEKSATLASRLKQPLKNTFIDRAYQRRKASERTAQLETIGLGSSMSAIEHHRAHASAAYYTAPWRESSPSPTPSGKTLVLTCDGSGDRLSATASIGEGSNLTRIAEVSEHDSIGRLYSLVTRYMGMVPLEHEYKVMGLAPYASNSRGAAAVAQMFQDLFEFSTDGLSWKRKAGVPSMYAAYGFLGRLLAGQRFDHIAAGTQMFIENMLARWVGNAARATGLSQIACSGGVFMNVKANLSILELPEIEKAYVFPSCGDESNSIGAACADAIAAGDPVFPLEGFYYGDEITDAEAQLALEEAASAGCRLRFSLESNIERATAEQLAQHKIVARASGKMEFGARALGNRSILARADSPDVVRTINEAIKNRDFWMPFAPSVLAESADRYYSKPKPIASPYMMFAFRSLPETRKAFPAGQHPFDFTARAHEVTAKHNPGYHCMLQEYESMTGSGIVLNTSFNLHGEPIVYRAKDCVDVFVRSGLQNMALGNWWVEKLA
ncbi:MAG: carbamoyltransferase C-terminal domain-containing protein [Acidobacteriota bacterium]